MRHRSPGVLLFISSLSNFFKSLFISRKSSLQEAGKFHRNSSGLVVAGKCSKVTRCFHEMARRCDVHNVHQDNYDFQSILGNISDEILQKELDKMLFILSEVIPGRERERMKQAYQVFDFLKARGLIDEQNVVYLVNLLKDIKREDLSKRLKNHNAHSTVKANKCIVVGESCSGKTALTVRVMYDTFPGDYCVTISPDCLKRNIYLEEKLVPVEIWDTAGMESLSNILPDQFFRDVSVVLIVFDITDLDSFTETNKWRVEVGRKCDDDIMLLLVGNKLDLQDKRAVTHQMGKQKAIEFGATYLEVSALDGENTEAILTEIAKALPSEKLHVTRSPMTRSINVSTQTQTPNRRRRWRQCNC